MIKMVVTDLDGTLLNQSRMISHTSLKTIEKLNKLGIIVCFATGRPMKGIEKFLEACNLYDVESYSITNTGACVYRNDQSLLLRGKYLDVSDYKLIQSFISNYDVELAAYSELYLYSLAMKVSSALIHDSHILSMHVQTTNVDDLPSSMCRFNIMGTEANINSAIQAIPTEVLKKYYTVRNETFSFELLSKYSGKGNALVYLMNYLDLKKDEVVVLGDNFNDIEMLKEVENSVAMGQSHKQVKKICKYTTDTNEREGFSKAIKKLIFDE